ncbi:DUF3618 domain-containing protein [Vreelandella sp. EE22]
MSDQQDHRSSEEIEKDIHRSRERLDSTLSEIEERFSPQHLLNASYDYLRHGGANEFFANLGNTIKENPVPFLVTGAGLGWLITAQRSPNQPKGAAPYANSEAYPHSGPGSYSDDGAYRSNAYPRSAAHQSNDELSRPLGSARPTRSEPGMASGSTGRAAPSAFSHPSAFDNHAQDESSRFDSSKGAGMKERVSGRARHLGQGASEAAHHLSDRAHHMGGSMRNNTSHLYQSTQHGMHDAGQWAKSAGQHTSDFIQEHPLVVGALGLALGAALGSILPSTRKEDEYMGDYRDRFMHEAADKGHEHADRMQHSLHERTEKMKNETDKDHQEDSTKRTPSDTQGEHMRYSDEAMPGHNAASGLGGNPGKERTPHEKDSSKKEHGLTDSSTPSGNTQGDDTLTPPKR